MHSKFLAALVTGFVGMAAPALASSIVSGTVVGNSFGTFSSHFPADNLTNQSGLSETYISGVTDFDTFAATHDQDALGDFVSSTPASFPGTIDFDLGANYSVTDIGIWNDAQGPGAGVRGLNAFSVLVGSIADFSDAISVGSFNATQVADFAQFSEIERFDLSDTTGRYVRLSITSNHGEILLQFGEVIFGVEPLNEVPVPASLPLLLAAVAGFGLLRRRT